MKLKRTTVFKITLIFLILYVLCGLKVMKRHIRKGEKKEYSGVEPSHQYTSDLRNACHLPKHPINPFAKGRQLDQNSITFKANSSCVELHFSQEHLPITTLTSFPGSGNTWTRHLLQQLTGIYTGSIYNNGQLKEHGFAENIMDGTVVAIKTHKVLQPSEAVKHILVIRRPNEALLAHFNQKYGGGSVAFASKENFNSKWPTFVPQQLERWHAMNIMMISKADCLLIVEYNKMKRQLREELIRLALFLGLDQKFINKSHLDCIINNQTGMRKRPGGQNISPHFTLEQNNTIEKYVKEVAMLAMKKHGVELQLE